MRLVRLTLVTPYGAAVWINPENIVLMKDVGECSMEPDSKGTIIRIDGGTELEVTEEPDVVLDLIQTLSMP